MFHVLPRFARLAVALALLAPTAHAAKFLGVEVPPPLPANNVIDTYWGTPVDDPYRFLENTKDPAVQRWMKGQADATAAILGQLPVRDTLLARIREIDAAVPTSITSVRRMPSGRYFFLRRNADDNQFKLVRRDTPTGADIVLVDPDAKAKASGKPHAIGGYTVSPDGRKLAYSISAGGAEIGSMHVIDTESGKEIDTPIEAIRGSGAVAWLEDGSGYFYTRLKKNWAELPASERFQDNLRYFRRLASADLQGADNDRAVFGPGVIPGIEVPRSAYGYVTPVRGTPYAVAIVTDGVKREQTVYLTQLADVLTGTAQWRKLFGEEAKVTATSIAGGWIYLKTADQAPRYRVLRMPLADPVFARAEVVIAAGDQVVVDVSAARDALYVTQRRGPVSELLRVPHAGPVTLQSIALPFAGNVDLSFADPDQQGAIVQLGSWIRAAQFYNVAADAKRIEPLPLKPAGTFDEPAGLKAVEVSIKSHDGVEVPISIVSRADIKLDGSNPTVIYGYGAYGMTEEPSWNPRLLAWLERGGVYVFAHVRGGGVFGDAWHRAGQKITKPNTWKDGIAAAEWLIAQGYTSPKRLAIYGGSAGGIFVGRAITARPDLFAAAGVGVGNTDSVRSETRANGIANIHEYGTVKREEEFRGLLAMSPYANIQTGVNYPAVLFEHGVNDTRVDVWMTLKTGSRLAAATASERPVLLRLEYDGGHGVGATRDQAQRRTADRWAFWLWQFGVEKP